jgi:hypothetical protein
MTRAKSEGVTALIDNLSGRLPNVEEVEINLAATRVLNFIAEANRSGGTLQLTLALIKANPDGISKQIRILELKDPDDPIPFLVEALFTNIKTPRKKRRTSRR